jgi:hypothetical protein
MSNNWWSNKLGTQQPAQRVEMPTAPSQQPMAKVPQSTNTQTTTFLPSNGNSTSCPSCRSKNYMKVGSQVTQSGAVDAWRCYDCGYPLTQTGTGIAGANVPSAGPTQAAIQVPTGGFNPTTIFGHM